MFSLQPKLLNDRLLAGAWAANANYLINSEAYRNYRVCLRFISFQGVKGLDNMFKSLLDEAIRKTVRR